MESMTSVTSSFTSMGVIATELLFVVTASVVCVYIVGYFCYLA